MSNINKTLVLTLFLIIFFTLAVIGLQHVGYYYDELLHAVATQELLIGFQYKSEVHHVLKVALGQHIVPLMILYYVGPIKSYALAPLFLLFPNSLVALRLFTILCGGLTIWGTWHITNKYFSQSIAIISTGLLATDPSFILSSRYDWGPIAIQNLLKLAILWLFFDLTNKLKLKRSSAFFYGALSAIMIWDKLNALWFIVPISLLLSYRLRNNLAVVRYALLGLVLFSLPILVLVVKRPFFYSESQKSFNEFEAYLTRTAPNGNLTTLLSNYQSAPEIKLQTLFNTLNGITIPNHILLQPLQTSGIVGYLLAILLIALLIKKVRRLETNQANVENLRTIYYLAVSVIVFIIVTPHANGAHHMLLLFPLPQIILASLMLHFWKAKRLILITISALIIISNLTVLYEFNSKVKKNEQKTFWRRTEIDSIVQQMKQSKGKYIALDWGITLPIGYLSNGQIPIRDLQAFYEPKCDQLHKYIQEGYSVISYTKENLVFPTYYNYCQSELRLLKTERPTKTYQMYTNQKK